MIWFTALAAIFLLPFIPTALYKAVALLIYAVLFACLSWHVLKRRKEVLKNTNSALVPLFAFLTVVIAVSCFSLYPAFAFSNAFYLIFSIVIFIFISALNAQDKRRAGLTLIIASFFISVIALLQRFCYFDRIIPYLIQQRPFLLSREFFYLLDIVRTKRVISTFTTPNLLASYLVMVNLLILGYIFSAQKKAHALLFMLVLIINCYCLWLTRSFLGFLSLFAGIALFILLMFFRARERLKRHTALFAMLIFSLLIMAIILAVERTNGAILRHNLSFAVDERYSLWRLAGAIIADKPFGFAGLGGFGYICRNYLTENSPQSIMVHNIFLQLWIETGIYGAAAFIWFLSALIRSGLKKIFGSEKGNNSAVLGLSALSAIFAFLLHNMAGFSFFVPQAAIIWWILCAFLVGEE